MKIAVIDPWCFTPPYNHELCKGLASIGHDVLLVGQGQKNDDDGQERRDLSYETWGLFHAPSASLPRSLALAVKGVRHVQGLLKSMQALRRWQPDVIHFQWLPLPLLDALVIPLLRRIAPIVLTVHDSNPYNGEGPLLLRFGNLLATRRFDRWIVHNEISERSLVVRGIPAERIHRVAHGLLDSEAGPPSSKGERADGRLHFLQFGKIRGYKGVDVFLRALGSLKAEQRERLHVSIVGRPYIDTQPLLDLVAQHKLQDCVEFRFNFVSDDEMAALFDQTDFLVFPYRAIDTSGVLMAAIACGLPVVASNIGCFSEMLTDGREGRLTPPDDPDALAAVLASLIENPSQAQFMSDNMAALKDRIPSWQRIAETTTQVYQLEQTEPASETISAHT